MLKFQQPNVELLESFSHKNSERTIPPIIVRIAGLSGSALHPFSSPGCLRHLAAEEDLEGELVAARKRLADRIAETLSGFAPEMRRFLLQVRRDGFNGRSLCKYKDRPEWTTLLRLSDGLAKRILDLEEKTAEARQTFALVYEGELERERRHLFGTLQDRGFLRGMALGSPELVTAARELAKYRESIIFSRKERKLEQTLLRFVTRSAAKLSPYSTLTAVALGTVRPEPELGGPAFQFVDGALREISLVRVNRALVDQYVMLLLTHPALREGCRVASNDTLREVEPGCWRFLRNGHWSFEAEERRFRFVQAAHVQVRLSGPLLASVREALAGGLLRYDALLVEIARRLGEGDPEFREHLAAGLDRLIDVGLLDLIPPWPSHEIWLENRLLEVFRTLQGNPALAGAAVTLERLVDLEQSYSATSTPELSVAALREAVDDFASEVDRISGREETSKRGTGLYEDVVLVPAGGQPGDGEVLRVSARRVEELAADADLVWRYAHLYNHRHDLTHTLAAFWADRWPERREMAFLDFFQEVSPQWTDYLRFDLTERYANLSSFNPFALPSIDRLNELRRALMEKAQALMRPSPCGLELPRQDLAALLEEIPTRYRPPLGACLFVQPADPEGNWWVLNRLFEGSGRYVSRYGALLEEPSRHRFTQHFTNRSTVEIDGEEADLLDLLFTSGSMVNLRVPQTARVLEMPGERVDLPEERRVRLSELRVHADLATESFWLTDGRGRRLLAVHMSSLNNVFLPVIIRLLSLFGPFETRQVFPRSPLTVLGETAFSERLVCGRLIIRRKRWEIALRHLPDGMLSASGADAFESVQRWRRAAGLPAHVFLFEQMHRGENKVQSYKPQYIDFSSPSLVSLFLSIARKSAEVLFFDEPLPHFSEFPLDNSGDPRAFELQIDSLALLPARQTSSFLPVSHRS
jgi:hypothetical protein